MHAVQRVAVVENNKACVSEKRKNQSWNTICLYIDGKHIFSTENQNSNTSLDADGSHETDRLWFVGASFYKSSAYLDTTDAPRFLWSGMKPEPLLLKMPGCSAPLCV